MTDRPNSLRTRGVKPDDLDARERRVADAIKELEEIGATFSVADIAERAGISRATIYRSQKLRLLVGARGDGARSVDADTHARVCARHKSLQSKARDLKQRLSESEVGWEEMRNRALRAEQRLRIAENRVDALSKQLAVTDKSHTTVPLAHLAAEIGIDEMKRARRQLALVLHPDLFSHDPKVAAVAGELLRAVNEAVE